MNYFVTGGAGFIGSNIVDALITDSSNNVIVYDNFSTGLEEFLESSKKRIVLIKGDLLDEDNLNKSMKNVDFVFHLAANADIRFGLEHPKKDLEQNTIGTFNVLEGMRKNNVKKIAFASTGPVYGEPTIFPTPENCPFPIQTSLYASSKLAGESLISSYCEGFGFTGYIFRFVSILGERYPHGHIFDFCKQLIEHPDKLYILGDGKQRKSYLYIKDCLKAIFTIIKNGKDKVNIYNLGTDEYCEVSQSAKWICDTLKVKPRFLFSGGERGWIGDNPFVFLDCTKLKKLGWKAEYTIEEAIVKTVNYLMDNRWLFNRR
jgi:UDP-glucose 4-epimerase